MSQGPGRRDFLKMTALAAAGVPALSTRWAIPAHAGGAAEGASMKAAYDPAGKFEIKVSEVEFRRNASGRTLMARIYQPQGSGPFPTLLDLQAAPGTTRTARRTSRWTARWRPAAFSWWPST